MHTFSASKDKKKNLTMIEGEIKMSIGKVAVHSYLTLIIKELKN
jgi:hypothetical protein